MTVDQLREALATMPGHWPVHVAMDVEGICGQEVEYFFVLDCERGNYPRSGSMAVIRINESPK